MNPINNFKCANDSDPSKQEFNTNKRSTNIKEECILESETTKGNYTVFEITFDGLYLKCKEPGDQKERERASNFICKRSSKHKKKDRFLLHKLYSVDTCLSMQINILLSNTFNSDTIVFVIHFL